MSIIFYIIIGLYYKNGATGGSIDIDPEPFQVCRMAQLLCKAPHGCFSRYSFNISMAFLASHSVIPIRVSGRTTWSSCSGNMLSKSSMMTQFETLPSCLDNHYWTNRIFRTISIILIIIADYTKMRNADLYNWNIDSLSENIISTLPVPCKEVFLPYRRKTSISRKVR